MIRALLDTTSVTGFGPHAAASVNAVVPCEVPAAGASDGAVIALPLGRDRIEGMLCAFRSSSTAFDPDILPIAMLYAGQASAAVENARLYRTVQNELCDRIRAEEAAKTSEQRLGTLLRSVHDLIVVVGEDDGSATPIRPPNSCGDRFPTRRPPATCSSPCGRRTETGCTRLLARLRTQAGLTLTSAVRLRRGSADWRDYDIVLSNLTDDPAIAGVVITCHDVTERRTYEQSLESLAFSDPLTGLANRAHFLDRLEGALARAEANGTRSR